MATHMRLLDHGALLNNRVLTSWTAAPTQLVRHFQVRGSAYLMLMTHHLTCSTAGHAATSGLDTEQAAMAGAGPTAVMCLEHVDFR